MVVLDAGRALIDRGRSVAVLVRSGAVELARPDRIVRAASDIRAYGPVAGALRVAARRHPGKAALIDAQRSVTFAELDTRTDSLAAALRQAGYGEHSTIGTLCRDHCGLVEAMMGAAKVGAGLVLLNTSMGATELGEVCAREGVTLVIHDGEFTPLITSLEVDRIVADSADVENGLESYIARGSTQPGPRRPSRPGALVALTGGTTGTPKGAPRTMRSPLAAAQFLDRIPLPYEGTTLVAAPLFHGTGLSQFLLSLALGTTNVLTQRFDPEAALGLIDEHRCTTVVLVPTMLRRILALGPEAIGRYDSSSLRVIFCAGSALPIDTGNEAIAVFGPVVYNLYGASEVGVATVATPEDWLAAPGTVGRAPASAVVRLYDETGTPITDPNVVGTIYVGGMLSFQGYTGGGGKKSIDGLLSSGDVGHWDGTGRLFVDGRDDEMIVSGGENVFPGQIEDLLYAHAEIDEAAIVPVPDDDFGQRLAAFVVRQEGSMLDEDAVRQYVKEHLARYKVPRDVTFVDSLPRTPSGKLLRRHLINATSTEEGRA